MVFLHVCCGDDCIFGKSKSKSAICDDWKKNVFSLCSKSQIVCCKDLAMMGREMAHSEETPGSSSKGNLHRYPYLQKILPAIVMVFWFWMDT